MNVLKAIVAYMSKDERRRYRDRRGFYVTDAMKCPRDLYWSLTGEPETNPTDLTGKLKMFCGEAVEKLLITNVLQNLHLQGVHFLGTQIPVGGSNPPYDGYLDGLIVESKDKTGPYVLEVKTKSGIGADMLLRSCDPGVEYLSQMGLYLRDLTAKGVTNRGCFLFILLSNENFGEMVQIDCSYNPATETITATKASFTSGEVKEMNLSYNVGMSIERLKKMEGYLKEKTCPPPAFRYKYPLTREFLDSISDYQLKAAIAGQKVLGDWQVVYSKYKDKQFAVDNLSPGYTEEERTLLVQEYKRRHPKSKVA